MGSTEDRFVRTASHWGAYWAEVSGGRIVRTRPFEKDPQPSALIHSTASAVHAPSRIDRPHIRKGFLEKAEGSDRAGRGAEPFVAVDWSTALDVVARELQRVKNRFGNRSIFAGSYGWASAGRLHHAQGLLRRFIYRFGGATVHVNSYSNGAGTVLLPHLLGDTRAVSGPVTSWRDIAANSKLMVSFGGLPVKNLQIEAGGPGEHLAEPWLRRLKDGGIDFVCIGPIREDMPEYLAAQWLHPAPGTDTAVMLGLAHTLVGEGLYDRSFIDRYTVGFERFRPYLMGDEDGVPKDADWAARISGLEAGVIRALARRMAATRTMITTSWSLQRADHGEQSFWMTIMVAALLGQIGLPGGGFGFGYGSMNRMGNPRGLSAPPAVPLGPNPAGSYIPVARIADMLLNPGATIDYNGERITFPDTRLVYWCGGNPFHHHQDLNRLLEAWRRPETIIVHDIWWTASARHADIVLPATTTLERNDIASASFDRFVLAMHKAINPVADARNDFDIFADLAGRLGFAEAFTEGRSEMEWLRHIYEVARQQAARDSLELPNFDDFWEQGYAELPEQSHPSVLFADFRADPAAHKLGTPSGRIELFSETIAGFGYDDCPGHPRWLEPAEWLGAAKAKRLPLHLISNQPTFRLHSQMDQGAASLVTKRQGREPIWLNPADAATRGIAEGDVVRVYNDRGACLAGAVLTDTVRRGVVQLQTGAWFDPLEPGRIGSLDRHGNPNMLTIDKGTSKLAQGSSAQTALVEVEKWCQAVPPITVFAPPSVVGR